MSRGDPAAAPPSGGGRRNEITAIRYTYPQPAPCRAGIYILSIFNEHGWSTLNASGQPIDGFRKTSPLKDDNLLEKLYDPRTRIDHNSPGLTLKLHQPKNSSNRATRLTTRERYKSSLAIHSSGMSTTLSIKTVQLGEKSRKRRYTKLANQRHVNSDLNDNPIKPSQHDNAHKRMSEINDA